MATKNQFGGRRFRWAATVVCGSAILAALAIVFSPETVVRADELQSPTTSSSPKDIIDTATGPGMEDVSILVKAIKAAGLVDILKGPGPFTVFAPTNDAFHKFPHDKLDMLLQPDHQQELATILKYHVVSGNLTAKNIMGLTELKTLDGDKAVQVRNIDEKTFVNEGQIIKADIKCTNGTIHWIDTVLLPN